MRKILSIGLVLLAAACGSEDEQKPIRYAPAQPPTVDEETAAASAATTFESMLATPTSPQPGAGVASLGDQIAGQLGGGGVQLALPAPPPAKPGAAALLQVIDPSTCAAVTYPSATETRVTWDRCHFVEVSGTMTVTFDVNGSMTWNEGTGHTTWTIDQANVMVDSTTGEQIGMTSSLSGWSTVTTSSIVAQAGSHTAMTFAAPGSPSMSFSFDTTLTADLEYVSDPAFCITGGTLQVEQRPGSGLAMGAPSQGWIFAWTGCGAFAVAHGG